MLVDDDSIINDKERKREDDNRNDNKSDSENVRGNENVVYISEGVIIKVIK